MPNFWNTGLTDKSKKIRKPGEEFAKVVLLQSIKIVSHGYPSRITFNLGLIDSDLSAEFNDSHLTSLDKEVFAPDAELYSYACRTANAPNSLTATFTNENWRTLAKVDESLAQKLADYFQIKVHAYVSRSDYTATWNDGNDLTYRGLFKDLKDMSVDVNMHPRSLADYDEALWNPMGAKSPVQGGTTPPGLPTKMLLFEMNKEPK